MPSGDIIRQVGIMEHVILFPEERGCRPAVGSSARIEAVAVRERAPEETGIGAQLRQGDVTKRGNRKWGPALQLEVVDYDTVI